MAAFDHLFNKCDQKIRQVKNQIITHQIPAETLKQLGLRNCSLVFSKGWGMLYLDKRCSKRCLGSLGTSILSKFDSTIPLLAREICQLLKKLRRSNTELKNVPKINSVINLSSRRVEFLIEIT